jgi:kynureninase
MVVEPVVSNMETFQHDIAFAQKLDQEDPLKEHRLRFLIPEKNGVPRKYFLGNSLGLQPTRTRDSIEKVLTQWSDEGVESFFRGDEPWLNLHDKLQQAMAPIAGAIPAEISIMNQLSVNIHLMLVSFYQPKGKRRKILMETKAFPSDQYAVRSHIQHMGLDPDEIIIELSASDVDEVIPDAAVISAIHDHGEELALVFWGGLNYYSGQLFDMKSIAKAAHDVGAKVGFDLAHAIGNVSLELHKWEVDFACWCSYKYLNGGPGAVAGVFIHEKHHNDQAMIRLAGWWGYRKEERFLMKNRFEPAPDAAAWQLSTPSILNMACLDASLHIFAEAKWENILSKQGLMNDWVSFLVKEMSSGSFQCITPMNRGCQISLLFKEKGREVYDSLFEKGFMVDWREPNVIRLAPVPLYNTFTEVYQFFMDLDQTLKTLDL